MFVGHCGPSFLAKRVDQSVPLGVLMQAAMLVSAPRLRHGRWRRPLSAPTSSVAWLERAREPAA